MTRAHTILDGIPMLLLAKWQAWWHGVSMDRLSASIADVIRASGQTPYNIAKGAGVAQSQLSRLLNGERGLSAESIERIADYLGLRITLAPKRKTSKGR